MIQPVNGNLLIEPLKHESFMATDKDTYEEIGVVVAHNDSPMYLRRFALLFRSCHFVVNVGDKVFFDSWLAAKYPKEDGGFLWLVNRDDVRAVEHAQDEIPK